MPAIVTLLIALLSSGLAYAQDAGGTKFRSIFVNMTADEFKAAWPGWKAACPSLYAQEPALLVATQTAAQIIKQDLDAVREKIKALPEQKNAKDVRLTEVSAALDKIEAQ